MKLVEKKRQARDQIYLLSLSRKEFRLLAASLNAVVGSAGSAALAEVVPVSERTIVRLQQQLSDALDAELTNVE